MASQQRDMQRQASASSFSGLGYTARLLFVFVPRTLLGPILSYAILYWWFVPASMRPDVPLSSPSTGLKVIASLLALPSMFISRHSSEALASSLPQNRATSLHRVIAPASFLFSALSGLSALLLFAPLVGLPALSPRAVVLVFCGFVAFAWLKTLKMGLGLFAQMDTGSGRLREVAGLSAPELLATDKRPPILYLRSFEGERRKATTVGRFGYIRNPSHGFYIMARRPRASDSFPAFLRKSLAREYKMKLLDSSRSVHDEQALFVELFSDFGPYIAIGRPGEAFESMDVGAAKYYVPDEAWMTTVVELIDSSAAIVIEASESGGLSWEIQQVLSRAAPEKVLLILPRNDADYRDFRIFAAGLFPYPMPEEIPRTRLIMFGSGWYPIPLKGYTMVLEDAVQPFVARLGLASLLDKESNSAHS